VLRKSGWERIVARDSKVRDDGALNTLWVRWLVGEGGLPSASESDLELSVCLRYQHS
jgi:hypothetical protein